MALAVGRGDRVGSHMAADKERGKADRAKGTEMRGGSEGGGEARTGRTIRPLLPSGKAAVTRVCLC